METVLYFDGGSRGHGLENDGYGTIQLYVDGQPRQMTVDGRQVGVAEMSWPNSTAPEAELKTALSALRYASLVESRGGKEVPFIFRFDATVVAFAVKGVKKPDKRLAHLYQEIKVIADANPHWTFDRISGDEIKEVLGH